MQQTPKGIISGRWFGCVERVPELTNLLPDTALQPQVMQAQHGWRRWVDLALLHRIPVPAMPVSLSYFDCDHAAALLQNLTQARRDSLVTHPYQRTDWLDAGLVYSRWPTLNSTAATGPAQ